MANSSQKKSSAVYHGGSMLAYAICEALTSTASPLLDHGDDGVAATGDATSRNAASEDSCLQPNKPTPQQVLSYNDFCHSIIDGCREQSFTFSNQDPDNLEVPPVHFEKQQIALPQPSYSDSLDPYGNIFHLYPEMTQTGGKELIHELADAIHQNRVADMARLFLRTCPGEENSGWYSITHYLLKNAARGFPEVEEQEWITADMIRFQWEISLLCDHIVSFFGLEAPNGQICLLWDDRIWYHYSIAALDSRRDTYNGIWSYLFDLGFPHRGGISQGPPFHRAVHYMAAALAETYSSFDECLAKAGEIVAFVKTVEAHYQERAVKNAKVIECGRNWLRTVGKQVGSEDQVHEESTLDLE